MGGGGEGAERGEDSSQLEKLGEKEKFSTPPPHCVSSGAFGSQKGRKDGGDRRGWWEGEPGGRNWRHGG